MFKSLFLTFLLIHSIGCQESDEYEDYSNDVFTNSTGNYTTNGMDYDSVDDHCSEEAIIQQMTNIFTPNDYEEGKLNIKSRHESLNETLSAVNRLQQFRTKCEPKIR